MYFDFPRKLYTSDMVIRLPLGESDGQLTNTRIVCLNLSNKGKKGLICDSTLNIVFVGSLFLVGLAP